MDTIPTTAQTEARTRKGVTLSPLLLRCSNDDGRDAVFKCSHLKGQIKFACLKAELEPQTGPFQFCCSLHQAHKRKREKKCMAWAATLLSQTHLSQSTGLPKTNTLAKTYLCWKKSSRDYGKGVFPWRGRQTPPLNSKQKQAQDKESVRHV